MNLNNVDFIIKTFKRYDCLERLLNSIYKYYPDADILIADDNSDQEFNKFFYKVYDKVKVYRMKFDSGISAGRNLLVQKSKKDFVLLLEDDFVFTDKTRIDKFYDIIVSRNTIGVVGGICVENGQDVSYEHYFEIKNRVLYNIPDGDKWEEINGIKCKKTGCVLNFALFRRKMLKLIQWDNNLKVVEHSDFYLQLAKYPEWEIYFTPEVKVDHIRYRTEDYKKYRLRWEEYFTKFFYKWGITKSKAINGNTITLVDNKLIRGFEPPKKI